jgi:hypothetical protein
MSRISSGGPPIAANPINLGRPLPRLLFWAGMVLAFVMAVMPTPPALPVSDKLQHAAAFLVLALLGRWAYPKTRKRTLLLGLAAFGALIEIVQALPIVGRDSDPLDWVADVSAALAVFLIIALWPAWKKREAA